MTITTIWTLKTAVNYYSNIKETTFLWKKVITEVNYWRITVVINAVIQQ